MKAVHFIWKLKGISLNGLSSNSDGTYRTCCWDISDVDANQLIGGWIYLHAAKKENSTFGGVVSSFEKMRDERFARPGRIAFTFVPRPEGRGQVWCGKDHSMA